MILASHQPDLLPYSGFWYKVARADVLDLKIYDQFVDRGYQRRVKMRDQWVSVPIRKGASLSPIHEARIDAGQAREVLARAVVGRYRGARYWDERGQSVLDLVESISTEKLWVFNHELILGMRDLLGIATPISIAVPAVGRRSAGVISVLKRYPGPLTYLSGTGARAYMGDCREFTEAGIQVEFSRHHAATGDSILSVFLDYREPMQVVLAESPADVPSPAPAPTRRDASCKEQPREHGGRRRPGLRRAAPGRALRAGRAPRRRPRPGRDEGRRSEAGADLRRGRHGRAAARSPGRGLLPAGHPVQPHARGAAGTGGLRRRSDRRADTGPRTRPRARPLLRRAGRPDGRPLAETGCRGRARVHDLPRHDRWPRRRRPGGVVRPAARRVLPRVLAGAHRPGQQGLDPAEHAQAGLGSGRRVAARPARVLRHRGPHDHPGLEPGGGRDGQAVREHLRPGQHRSRQRAGRAVPRPGHQRLGRHRRREHQGPLDVALDAGPRRRRTLPPVDPAYLSWIARTQTGKGYRLSELAQEINDSMPAYSVQRASALLDGLHGREVLVLGAAYKPNTGDLRESPAIEVIRELREAGARVTVSDPHVTDLSALGVPVLPAPDLASSVGRFDLVMVVTDHDAFPYEQVERSARRVLDCRARLRPSDTVDVL